MRIFSERLRELRLDKKLSAKSLGLKIGVSDSTLIRWENGTMLPTIDNLYNICKFFGVSADYLIGIEN